MTKILFIIPYIPYPLDSGGNQAFFHMVDFLRNKMSISVLLFSRNQRDEENIRKLRQIWSNVTFFIFTSSLVGTIKEKETIIVKNPFYYKLLTKLQNSIGRKIRRQICNTPHHNQLPEKTDMIRMKSTLNNSFDTLDERYVEYVMQIANKGFDIIQVEFYELISLGYILPKNVKTIFVHHELRYIRNENEMKLFQEITATDNIRYQVARNFERDALQQYQYIITLTEVDKDKLRILLGDVPLIYISPATIQIDWTSSKFIPCTNNRITFVGSEDHFPNLDAVTWFCREIAPVLRQHNFRFSFQVIGKWKEKQTAEQLHQTCPELELVGYVEHLHNFLSGSIAVVPVRIGSGMRMKILDSVSSSVPFVTTTKGVEGINLQNRNECLIADTPEEFANAIIQLALHADLQQSLVNNAQKKLRSLYDSTCMLNQRLSIYKEITTE